MTTHATWTTDAATLVEELPPDVADAVRDVTQAEADQFAGRLHTPVVATVAGRCPDGQLFLAMLCAGCTAAAQLGFDVGTGQLRAGGVDGTSDYDDDCVA